MTYLLILAAYSVLMILLGVFFSRRVKSSSDFYVAGRGLSAGLIFSTLLAANIGAGSTVGATGLGFRDGLSAWWWVGSAGIGSLILAFTVGPRIWRDAREHHLLTVGDYLEYRYNSHVRGVVVLLLWIGSLAILAGQLIAIAWILNVTAGIGKPVGCLIGAGVATVYFTAGGLLGTARVNALQLVIKLVGFGAALIYLLQAVGGWEQLQAGIRPRVGTDYLSFIGGDGSTVWRYLIMLAPSFIVSPGLLQKIFGARDVASVRRGVGLNALALLGFAIVPTLLGIIAHAQHPHLLNRELAMPTLLTQSLPLWLGGLLLGALFSAEVSTADAVLFMLSTSLSRDLYQRHLAPQADDRQLMRMTRAVAIACGLGGALLGIWIETVISALTIFYTLLTAALFLPLVAGLYLPRVSARGALASIVASVSVTFLLEQLKFGWAVPPLVCGVLVGTVFLFFKRNERQE